MVEQYLLSGFWRPYICHFTKKVNRGIYIKCIKNIWVAFIIRENTTVEEAKKLISEITK